ncbi:MAG: tRNA 2-thiouridine(34) synthase MnmA [Sphaerochaetaceae bacterium]|jgi:tRNA-uridine 2-sulfurtransferase|nr:tRNA 2-thiouridine(34) synthase MnmA [Sphaerochaetaceae bacterium]NLY07485.1 tRNA 2-thiouridine(34) synthase MnmA [Spirochaetales bacterium]
MKVLLGLSGGIDSAVSAYLLGKQGYEIEAVNMILWSGFSDKTDSACTNKCCDGSDSCNVRSDSCFSPNKEVQMKKVRLLASRLGIAVSFIDCSSEFQREVLGNFRTEYMRGCTPNPCVICNHMVKFGALVEKAEKAGLSFDKVATGHYARVEKKGERFCLRKGVDEKKDQSYFLCRLSQEQLSKVIFPLGGLCKDEVRRIDVANGFHEEKQTESQDFYSGPYSELLNVKPRNGNIVDTDGRILGTHKGFWNYTIGQRKGLGIAAPHPLYVIELRPDSNEVVVGWEESTRAQEVRAADVNWVSVADVQELAKCHDLNAKIRSVGGGVPCTVTCSMDDCLGKDGPVLQVLFEHEVNSPTPGQSLVVYDSDGYVLCGGTII